MRWKSRFEIVLPQLSSVAHNMLCFMPLCKLCFLYSAFDGEISLTLWKAHKRIISFIPWGFQARTGSDSVRILGSGCPSWEFSKGLSTVYSILFGYVIDPLTADDPLIYFIFLGLFVQCCYAIRSRGSGDGFHLLLYNP